MLSKILKILTPTTTSMTLTRKINNTVNRTKMNKKKFLNPKCVKLEVGFFGIKMESWIRIGIENDVDSQQWTSES